MCGIGSCVRTRTVTVAMYVNNVKYYSMKHLNKVCVLKMS